MTADAWLTLNQVNVLTGVGDTQGGFDAGDATPNHQCRLFYKRRADL